MYFRSSTQMTKSANPFLLNTHELPRRTGEMKEYQLDIESNARIGVPLIAVPEGDVKIAAGSDVTVVVLERRYI